MATAGTCALFLYQKTYHTLFTDSFGVSIQNLPLFSRAGKSHHASAFSLPKRRGALSLSWQLGSFVTERHYPMRYKASPSPNDSSSNQGPTRIVFLSHYLIAVEHRSSRPSPKEPIIKTTRPESRPLPTIASLSACKDNDLLITQTEEKWPSIML